VITWWIRFVDFIVLFSTILYVAVVCRDIYDKMRADLRLNKEEAQRIETSRAPKVNNRLVAYYAPTQEALSDDAV